MKHITHITHIPSRVAMRADQTPASAQKDEYALFNRLSDEDYSSHLKDAINWAEANIWDIPIYFPDVLIEASIRLEESKNTLPEKPSIHTPCEDCFYSCKHMHREPCPNYIYMPLTDAVYNKEKGE